MNRTIFIPIGGTIAVILAIVLARSTEASRRSVKPPPASAPLEEMEGNNIRDAFKESTPEHFTLDLKADGSITDPSTGEKWKDIDALLSAIAPEGKLRPVVMLANEPGKVTEETLDAAVAKLKARCDAFKEYRVEQAPPK